MIPNPDKRGKRLVILHAGCEDGFLDGTLLCKDKKLKGAHFDYHNDMNSDVFEL